MIRALAAIGRLFPRSNPAVPTPPAPSGKVEPPAFCRKIVRDRAWTWDDCTHPSCGCEDATVVAEDLPPVKHRDLYAEDFDVEG